MNVGEKVSSCQIVLSGEGFKRIWGVEEVGVDFGVENRFLAP